MTSKLDDKPQKDETTRDKVWYWFQAVMNFAFPALKAAAIVTFRTKTLVKGESPNSGLQVFTAVSWDGVGLFQIISGVQLIGSIILIRRFFNERKDEP